MYIYADAPVDQTLTSLSFAASHAFIRQKSSSYHPRVEDVCMRRTNFNPPIAAPKACRRTNRILWEVGGGLAMVSTSFPLTKQANSISSGAAITYLPVSGHLHQYLILAPPIRESPPILGPFPYLIHSEIHTSGILNPTRGNDT